MIEKLDKFDSTEASIYHAERLYVKVNQLIDAVNGILDYAPLEMAQKAEPDGDDAIQEAERVDPYADQRKWIGKLCRFWDSDINDDVWGILQDIKDNKTEKYYLYGIGYEHCEPAKPTDSIIYKGE